MVMAAAMMTDPSVHIDWYHRPSPTQPSRQTAVTIAIRTPASSWAMTTRAATTSHHGESVRKSVTGTMMCSVTQSVNASVYSWTFSSILLHQPRVLWLYPKVFLLVSLPLLFLISLFILNKNRQNLMIRSMYFPVTVLVVW